MAISKPPEDNSITRPNFIPNTTHDYPAEIDALKARVEALEKKLARYHQHAWSTHLCDCRWDAGE